MDTAPCIRENKTLNKLKTNQNLSKLLLKAKKCCIEDEYIRCLNLLDQIVYISSLHIRELRSILRERVNDLQGAYCDIKCCSKSPANAIIAARLLAKLGYVEKSIAMLRSLLESLSEKERQRFSSLALGIAGRRFDLELLFINNSIIRELDLQMKGCAIEHFLALGELDSLQRIVGEDTSQIALLQNSELIRDCNLYKNNNQNFRSHIKKIINNLRGWLSIDEACLLATLASQLPPEKVILEVGSFQGRSTCALAAGSKIGSNNKIHVVDTFSSLNGIFPESTLPVFLKNIKTKGFSKLVTIHQNTSAKEAEKWFNRDIGLLFIDADHSYESVKNDFNSWSRHLAHNGLIVFHDSNQKGPNRLILEILKNERYKVVTYCDSITVICLNSPINKSGNNHLWQTFLGALGENFAIWCVKEKVKLKVSALERFDYALALLGKLEEKKIKCQTPATCVTDQPTVLVDVTYKCNSLCAYCQWGNQVNSSSQHLPLKAVLLSAKKIKDFQATRVVISGGEPLLHPKLPQIISYYRKIIDSVVLITNGHKLNMQTVSCLIKSGLTGLAVSIDSMDSKKSEVTRGTDPTIHNQIISELKAISEEKINLEIGINSVVSSLTANWKNVKEILNFGKSINAKYVKFQPIFDDGYVTKNAPYLKLNSSNCLELYRIAKKIQNKKYSFTNPPGFWENIADIAMGKLLDPRSCNLKDRLFMIQNYQGICYWLPSSYFSDTKKITSQTIKHQKEKFEALKKHCQVDYHCFCLQNLSHVWDSKEGFDE